MTNPGRDDQVVLLRAQGLSYRQIAARLGTSLGFVQRALRRAEEAEAFRSAETALERMRAERLKAMQTITERNPQ